MDSLERSRERRARAQARPRSLPDAPRQATVAAAVVLAGAPVTAAAANGDSEADTWGARLTQSIQDARTPARPAPVKRTTAAVASRQPRVEAESLKDEPAPPRPPARAAQSHARAGLALGVATPATRAVLSPPKPRKRARRAVTRPAVRTKSAARKATVRAASATHTRRGGGVKALQRALGVTADGVFGAATEKALKRWQRARGLEADGVVGPATRRALKLGPGPTLKRERRGRRRRSRGGGGGASPSVVQRVIAAANRIAGKPYRYGGGHGSFTDSGYDCSGSVSYALHGGGLLSSPLDSSGFMSYGRPGPGKHITIYANPGHVYMTINGRRFDTSAVRQTGSRWGGPRSTGGYTVRHPAGL